MFQFTHPGKGATGVIPPLMVSMTLFQFTHPGKGATTPNSNDNNNDNGFNSRTLGRVRHGGRVTAVASFSFNSRTLGRVRRVLSSEVSQADKVSIHAPWEGCDSDFQQSIKELTGFNSRTLGRVRPFLWYHRRNVGSVSIHAPWEGCDFDTSGNLSEYVSFNSRTLGRVRHRMDRKQSD